ncbi:MAG: hypothetical protein AAGH68_14430 [Pseudomonadota bacterium]
MLLERTITQLDIGEVPDDQAEKLGHLGFMQWLAALPATSNYRREASRALALATPFESHSPAVAVFCDLVITSVRLPLVPLELRLPERQRRGGSRARRAML